MDAAAPNAQHPLAADAVAADANERRRRSDRRARATPLFSRYTLFGGRRKSDRRLGNALNSYVDVYEPWVGATLVAIGALCALDAIFTLLYIQKGGSEANPIMDALIAQGPVPFLVVKCGVTNLGLAILCLHKNFRYVKVVIAGLFLIYGALTVYHLWLAAALP